MIFNSALLYETALLKPYVEPLLFAVPKDCGGVHRGQAAAEIPQLFPCLFQPTTCPAPPCCGSSSEAAVIQGNIRNSSFFFKCRSPHRPVNRCGGSSHSLFLLLEV